MQSKAVFNAIMEKLRKVAEDHTQQITQHTPEKLQHALKQTLEELYTEKLIPGAIAVQPVQKVFSYSEQDKTPRTADITSQPCRIRIAAVGILGEYLKDLQQAASEDYDDFMKEAFAKYELALFDV